MRTHHSQADILLQPLMREHETDEVAPAAAQASIPEILLSLEEKETPASPALIQYLKIISTPECEFTLEDLQQSDISIKHFNTLLAIENHPIKKWFRWMNMIYWIEQALHSPFLSRRSLQADKTENPASRRPIYLTGRSLPLKEPLSIRLSYIVTALNQGTTNAFQYLLTLTAVGLAVYKMVEDILSLGSDYLPSLLSDLLDYQSNGLDAILHLLADIEFRYTGFIFLLPPVIAVARAVFYAKQSRPLSLKHLDRWLVYFMHEAVPAYAEKKPLQKFLEAVLQRCRLPMPARWLNKPEPARRMPGCDLRLMESSVSALHQQLVAEGHEVLLILQNGEMKLGFKNNQGCYEERTLGADQFPDLLRTLHPKMFDGCIHREAGLQAMVNQAIQTCGGKTLLHTFSWTHDFLRWMLPFHPTGDRLEHIERRIRWDGRYLVQNRREITSFPEWRRQILTFIATVARYGHTFSKSSAIYSLAKIAHGLAFSQIPLLVRAGFSKREILSLLYVKVHALKVITEEAHRLWSNLRNPLHPRHLKIGAFVHLVFTRFNLWGLGDFENRALTLFFTLLAGGLFVSAAFIFKTIGQAIAEYQECPYRPYSFYHGYQYQHVYPQTCLNAFSHVFDQPASGEPFNRYLDALPFFNMANMSSTEWDANKNWNGTKLASVLDTLGTNGAAIRDIYVVGQDLSTPESVNALMPSIPSDAQLLYVGNSQLENINSQPTIALVSQAAQLQHLRAVYLVRNNLGAHDSRGAAATAALLLLPDLEILSYEDNAFFGFFNEEGFLAIAENLPHARKLRIIDFNGCSIGQTSDVASTLFTQNLPTTIEELNLKNNYWGLKGISSTQQLTQTLPRLTQLKKLDLSGNNIPVNQTVFLSLIQAAAQLPNLQAFYFQQTIPLSVELVQQIRGVLSASTLITDLPVAVTPEEAVAYIQQLPSNTTMLDLRRKISNPTPAVVTALFAAVEEYLPDVVEIDVSDNQFGLANTLPNVGNVQALAAALIPIAPQIQALKMNGNFLDYQTSNDTLALSTVLPYCTRLTHLELNNNQLESIDSFGVQTLFANFSYLQQLIYFSAKGNLLGFKNTLAGQALASAISQAQPPLEYLDLSFNFLGQNGEQDVVALFNSFPSIASSLQVLNMAFNKIGSTGTAETQAILAAFRRLRHLAQVYLQGAQNIDWAQTNAALQNTLVPTVNEAVMFQACDQIVCFRASIPALDQLLGPVPASPLLPQAPLSGLFALPSLPGNDSQTVTASSSRLTLPFYLQLPLQLWIRIEHMFFGDILKKHGAWRQQQAHDSKFEETHLSTVDHFRGRAETMHCAFNTTHQQRVCVDEPNRMIRIVTSHTNQPIQEIFSDNYMESACVQTEYNGMVAKKCVGEKTEFVEFHVPKTPEAPSMFETASVAAAKSAACVIVPEVADIGLQVAGYSAETGQLVKEALNETIHLIAANSLLSASADLAGFAAGYLCQWWGMSTQTATRVATAVRTTTGVVGQTLQNPAETLSIASTTAVSFAAAYAASKFTFWAKNKLQRHAQENPVQRGLTQRNIGS